MTTDKLFHTFQKAKEYKESKIDKQKRIALMSDEAYEEYIQQKKEQRKKEIEKIQEKYGKMYNNPDNKRYFYRVSKYDDLDEEIFAYGYTNDYHYAFEEYNNDKDNKILVIDKQHDNELIPYSYDNLTINGNIREYYKFKNGELYKIENNILICDLNLSKNLNVINGKIIYYTQSGTTNYTYQEIMNKVIKKIKEQFKDNEELCSLIINYVKENNKKEW